MYPQTPNPNPTNLPLNHQRAEEVSRFFTFTWMLKGRADDDSVSFSLPTNAFILLMHVCVVDGFDLEDALGPGKPVVTSVDKIESCQLEKRKFCLPTFVCSQRPFCNKCDVIDGKYCSCTNSHHRGTWNMLTL